MVLEGIILGIVFLVQFIGYIIVLSIIAKVLLTSFKRKSNKDYFKNNIIVCNDEKPKKRYKDIDSEDLAVFQVTDLTQFKDYFYKLFYDFETAYNNLDYSILKSLSTRQLYQNYYTGISLDLKQGNKRIIKDIDRVNVIVFETISTTVKQAISTVITISYIDYVENKHGDVISGNKNLKVTESFEVIFRKDFGKDEPINCPNCGAPTTGNKCEFCKTPITEVDFKISSIKKIIDF